MCLMVTVGLPYRLDSPRVVAASEPYPGRWTHHVLVTEADQIDEELMGWLREAWDFCGEQAMRYTREELAEPGDPSTPPAQV